MRAVNNIKNHMLTVRGALFSSNKSSQVDKQLIGNLVDYLLIILQSIILLHCIWYETPIAINYVYKQPTFASKYMQILVNKDCLGL